MIPLRDTLRPKGAPFVTRVLLVTNVIVFALQLLSGSFAEKLVFIFGFVPARLFDPARSGYSVVEVAITFVSSLFLHGGFVHLIGNMLYLWVFSNTVEFRFGAGRFFGLYIACGAFGSLMHALLFPGSLIPSIGASGSIAGILGAFLVLAPRSKIVTLFPLIVSWAIAEVPALLFLPAWFLMQFLNGFFSLSSAKGVQEVAGVAWWAHIGGFILGAICALVFRMRHRGAVVEGGAA